MKKKSRLGIFLLLFMFLLTACGSREDIIVENEQAYEMEVQESAQNDESALPENQQEYEEDSSQSGQKDEDAISETAQNDEPDAQEQPVSEEEPQEESVNANLPVEGEYYYDLTNVVLYLEIYGELPPNYITKKEAQSLGWEGGSVEKYQQGAAIGGDSFGNREGLLPGASGRSYTECDLDTGGGRSRGANRLVFSNDGLYFYTGNHYESFIEVTVTEDYEVKW